MQTLDPSLVSTVVALSAAVLMVHAGVGKRLLSWRREPVRRRQRRRPRRHGRGWIPAAGAEAPVARSEMDEMQPSPRSADREETAVGRARTVTAEPTRGALPAAPRRDNVRFGAAVYGSFLVASVVGVAFETGQDAQVMTTTAFGSAIVFWLAHWWSEVIGEQISAGEAFRHRDVLVVARREWPLVEAAVLPTLLLALAWAGVWSRETGAELALAAALLQITGWALVAGRRAGWTWRRAGLFAAVDGALGTVLLLLEKLVH